MNQLTIHINRISSLLIFVLFCHFLPAQDVFNNPYNFQKLDFSINQYKIKALAQQKNSFLWIGTDNGLHRFDGQNIKQYSYGNTRTNPVSLLINDLLVSRKNKLWIATAEGISVLDPIQDTFGHFVNSKYTELQTSITHHIYEDADEKIWIVLDNRDPLYYEESRDTFISIPWKNYIQEQKLKVRKYNCINTIKDKSKDEIWICSNVGLYSYNKKKKEFVHYHNEAKLKAPIEFSDIYSNNGDTIYVSTSGDGFAIYNLSSKLWEYHKASPKSDVLSDDFKRWSIQSIGNNKLWVACSEGLLEYDMISKHSILINDTTNANRHIPNRMIFTLCTDDNNVKWVGGERGLWKVDPRFQCIPKILFDLKGRHVAAIYHDEKKDEIYFATKQSGSLLRYNFKTNVISELHCPSNYSFVYSHKIIRYQNFLWVSATNRLALFDLHKECFVYELSQDVFKSRTLFTSFELDQLGQLYCGLFDVGLIHFDFDYEKLKLRSRDTIHRASDVTDLVIDSNKILICDHSSRIYQYEFNTKSKSIFFDIANDSINSSALPFRINKDDQGDLWMITKPSGLWCISKDKKLNNYSQASGLSTSIFFDFETLPSGNLVLKNNQNLFLYNPKKNQGNSFDAHYGLAFSDGASQITVTDNGYILTGRKNGFLFFHPDSLVAHTKLYQPFIAELRINNKRISEDEYRLKLDLKHNENNIEITPSLLNIDPMQSMQLEYQFVAGTEDTSWRVLYTLHPIQLLSLSPGDYKFKLRTSNKDGETFLAKDVIEFRVNKHFAQTWWFRSLILLFILGLLYTYYRIKIQELVKMQKLKNKVANDLHDDIASTITSIGFYSDFAMKKVEQSSQVKSLLETISINAKEATESLRDIVWTLHTNEESMGQLIDKINHTGKTICDAKQVNFILEHKNLDLNFVLNLEAKKVFYLSFKEALNNALKYSQCSKVSLNFIRENGLVTMSVTDNGKGFDMNNVRKGRGVNSIEERCKVIHGKAFIKSEIGVGTCVAVSIPEQKLKG